MKHWQDGNESSFRVALPSHVSHDYIISLQTLLPVSYAAQSHLQAVYATTLPLPCSEIHPLMPE